jgi:uncharacterized protein (TIGR04255 family)
MSKKRGNAPVYFTVAQVRFNPVLNLEGYLSPIQEKMRKRHFPDFRQDTVQQLIIPFASTSDGGQPPSPSFTPRARCFFGNIDRTTEFVLEHNAFALQTTAYDTSDAFFQMVIEGLGIVHDVLSLDFMERIGLRYFDAVIPKDGEALSKYLTPEVLGLSHKLKGKLAHSYSETVIMAMNCQLVSRVIVQDGCVGLPPEIMPLAPKINQRFTEPEGRHAIIDTDAFFEQREAFSLEKVRSKLIELHAEIQKSFKETVTKHALDEWK